MGLLRSTRSNMLAFTALSCEAHLRTDELEVITFRQ